MFTYTFPDPDEHRPNTYDPATVFRHITFRHIHKALFMNFSILLAVYHLFPFFF